MFSITRRHVRLLALAAGIMDFSTGLGLVLFPTLTLRLMLVDPPAGEALHLMRFVGCFVWAVGFSYLWGLNGPDARLRVVFGVTQAFRAAAGAFTLISVCLGALSPAWLIVSATDLGLLACQAWCVRRQDLWRN